MWSMDVLYVFLFGDSSLGKQGQPRREEDEN